MHRAIIVKLGECLVVAGGGGGGGRLFHAYYSFIPKH